MQTSIRMAIIFLYCLGVLYGVGYVVFFKDASAWWFLLTGFLLPSNSFIARVCLAEREEPEDRSS
jgi:hypothetical protein